MDGNAFGAAFKSALTIAVICGIVIGSALVGLFWVGFWLFEHVDVTWIS